MFDALRKTIAKAMTPTPAKRETRPPLTMARMYAAAKPSRLTTGWGNSTTSEDGELSSSLRTLRNRSRELVRDSAYAKRAKVIVQNNVVGSGIGLQAKVGTTRGSLNQRINDDLEAAHARWAEAQNCHTGGALHLCDLERLAMGQVFEAGEIIIRKHRRAFGNSAVPLALEVIEPERLADEFQPSAESPEGVVRLGVEVDQFHRPIAYWIRTVHPGEIRANPQQTSKIERVPAADIMHLRLIDRWPQTRGVPWLHAAARRLNDMDGLGESEIVAARAAACYMGFIELPNAESQYGDEQADGSRQSELEPAMIERLNPGEKFNFAAPNRPNAQLDPFMRLMLREVAAGIGVSYESLSRDYSQSNYSSSRLALLDDRDLWKFLQLWFIRNFRLPLYREWVQAAVLSGAVSTIGVQAYALDPERFEAVRFKPRGWSWIDPTKEVEAYKEAIKAGFTTQGRVIEQTGNGDDLEDVLQDRKHELELADSLDLTFDTDLEEMAELEAETKSASAPSQPGSAKTDMEQDDNQDADAAIARMEQLLRGVQA